MKVILIEEIKFVDLLDQLNTRKLSLAHENTNFLRKPDTISQQHWEGLIQDIHQDFQRTFVIWAQREGASCVK